MWNDTHAIPGSPAVLQFHLEPDEPIEVGELTDALNAVASQYESFTKAKGLEEVGDAKLLVSSVSPGSIDINFVLEVAAAVATVAPIVDAADVLTRFAEHVKNLLGYFWNDGKEEIAAEPTVSIKDCNDAINLVSPIANHGGNQTFNIIKGPLVLNIGRTDEREARKITASAARKKAELQFPNSERRQRVSMVWDRLDRDAAKVKGVKSPDKGIIQEIDPKAKAILFTDELSYIKSEMLVGDENPMKKVYFVDVEISRVAERITAYRITGFHGSDDLNND